MSKEKVLVFPAHMLDDLGRFQGLLTGPQVPEYLSLLLDPAVLTWMDRDEAEVSPDFKQVIPYAVLLKWNQLYHYTRTKKGGEGRLHGQLSIGIGGHINPIDGVDGDAYRAGFLRELAEEVSIKGSWEDTVVGLVNDDSTDVGAVHFGVVHAVRVSPSAEVSLNDPALADGGWEFVPPLKRRSAEMESWSRLLIERGPFA